MSELLKLTFTTSDYHKYLGRMKHLVSINKYIRPEVLTAAAQNNVRLFIVSIEVFPEQGGDVWKKLYETELIDQFSYDPIMSCGFHFYTSMTVTLPCGLREESIPTTWERFNKDDSSRFLVRELGSMTFSQEFIQALNNYEGECDE